MWRQNRPGDVAGEARGWDGGDRGWGGIAEQESFTKVGFLCFRDKWHPLPCAQGSTIWLLRVLWLFGDVSVLQ